MALKIYLNPMAIGKQFDAPSMMTGMPVPEQTVLAFSVTVAELRVMLLGL
jgi:hypothetical protein